MIKRISDRKMEIIIKNKNILINGALILISVGLCFAIIQTPSKYILPAPLPIAETKLEADSNSTSKPIDESTYEALAKNNIFKAIVEKVEPPPPPIPPPPTPPPVSQLIANLKLTSVIGTKAFIQERNNTSVKKILSVGDKYPIQFGSTTYEIELIKVSKSPYSATFGMGIDAADLTMKF